MEAEGKKPKAHPKHALSTDTNAFDQILHMDKKQRRAKANKV